MSTPRLPEIPPDQRFKWDQEQDDTFGDLVGPVPDGEWMRVADAHAYGLAVWKAAIEAAARACDALAERSDAAAAVSGSSPSLYSAAGKRECAEAIRSLPDPSATPQDQGGER